MPRLTGRHLTIRGKKLELFRVRAQSKKEPRHHELRRTNEDKRRAVMTLLEDDEWSGWSDNEIARRCAVSPTTVGTTRRSLSNLDSDEPRTYTTKHGTTATMQTGNIGKTGKNGKKAAGN